MVVGIDFGAAFCRTAVCRQGEVEVFPNRFAQRPLPVTLALEAGAPATASIKEKLGATGPLTLDGRRLGAVEAAAEVFSQLRADALEFARGSVDRAVVGAPACLMERQRAALQEAAERGGFRGVRLLDESVAALLGPEPPRPDQTVLVYALGAGGFCASVVRVEGGAVRELCHEGQPGLGGHLLTAEVLAAILERLPLTAAQLEAAPEALSRLRDRAEQVKLGLSRRTVVEFDVNLRELFPPEVLGGGGGGLQISLSREEFEARISGYVDATVKLAQEAVRGAGGAALDAVLLLGGSTLIPLVERRLKEQFPVPARRATDTAVASGLAWFGAQLAEAEWERPAPPAPPPKAKPSAAPSAPGAEPVWSERFTPSFQDAQVAWLDGDPQSAIARIQRIQREEMPRFLGELYGLWSRLLLRAAHCDDAIAAAQRAVALDPGSQTLRLALHQAFSGKARFLHQRGRLTGARDALQQALQVNPDCPRCREFRMTLEAELRAERRSDSRQKKRGR